MLKPILALLGIVLLLTGCTSVTLTSTFDPTAAAYAKTPGTSELTGQAFMRRNDGIVVYAAGSEVLLLPKVAYTTEYITQVFGDTKTSYFNREIENQDPRLKDYVHGTIADGEGRFTFNQLAPGTYYVMTTIHWMAGNYSQGGQVYEEIRVPDGETVQVIVRGY